MKLENANRDGSWYYRILKVRGNYCDFLSNVRDYSQNHGEMKRVVNTILQLFDHLPQSSMVIAATNQKEMLDEALLRRFDISISLELPEKEHIASGPIHRMRVRVIF